MRVRGQMRTFVCATPECGRVVYTYRPERAEDAESKCARCHAAIRVAADRKRRKAQQRRKAMEGKKRAAQKLVAWNRSQSMAARMEEWNAKVKSGWKQ